MFEEEIPLSQHDQLAMAIAQGKSIAEWCSRTGCPGGRPKGGPPNPMSAARSRTAPPDP